MDLEEDEENNSEIALEDSDQVDLEDMIAEVEAEEETTVTEATESEAIDFHNAAVAEPTIEEQIAEDEAAVAEVCDEPSSPPLGSDDMNSCPEDDADFDLDFSTEPEKEEIDVEDGDLPDLF